jgi:hypothetical protein
MHTKRITALVVVALMLMIAGLIAGLIGSGRVPNPLKIPIVKQSKLFDVAPFVTQIEFTSPDAIHSVLLLGHSNQVAIESLSAAKIVLSNKNGRFELPLNKTTMTPCNWLDRFSINGFLLSDPQSASWDWTKTLGSGSTNLLVVTNIPAGASIWLSYTRPYGWDLPLIGRRNRRLPEVRPSTAVKNGL